MELEPIETRMAKVKAYIESGDYLNWNDRFKRAQGPSTCFGCRSCQYVKCDISMISYTGKIENPKELMVDSIHTKIMVGARQALEGLISGKTVPIVKCNMYSKQQGVSYYNEDTGCRRWYPKDYLLSMFETKPLLRASLY